MNIEELNGWIKTDEGKSWLDKVNEGLIRKRDELLATVKNLKKDLQVAHNEAEGSKRLLQENQESIRRMVIDEKLNGLMERYRIIPRLKNAVRSELEEQYTFDVKDRDGKKIGVAVDSEGEERSIDELFEWWASSENWENNKFYMMAPKNSGGGSKGSDSHSIPPSVYSRESISKMSPEEIAKNWDDPNFQSAVRKMQE